MGGVDRRCGRSGIDSREPPGIAVGQDLDGLAIGMTPGLDQIEAMATHRHIEAHILVGDLVRHAPRDGNTIICGVVDEGRAHLVQRPAQIDSRRSGLAEQVQGIAKTLVGGVTLHRERNPIGRRRTDQRCPPHLHGADRHDRIFERVQLDRHQLVRQPRLVDDGNRPMTRGPDGPHHLAVNLHRPAP